MKCPVCHQSKVTSIDRIEDANVIHYKCHGCGHEFSPETNQPEIAESQFPKGKILLENG